MNRKKSYEKDSIVVLSDIEHVQSRPGMYVGELNNPRQLLSEAIDNAMDEIQSGHSKSASLFIDTESSTYRVVDYGRGIPIGKIDGIETVELLAEKAFSGAKFDNITYKISAGLHGLGILCINALSESFKLTTRRKGKYVTYTSSRGKKEKLLSGNTTDPDGVTIEFRADSNLYEYINVPVNYIKERIQIARSFGFDINLFIDNQEIEIPTSSIYDLLPSDYNHEYCKDHLKIKIPSGDIIEVAFAYTSETNCICKGFTNLLYNPEGGTHVKLTEHAIKDAWTNHVGKEFIINDCLIGLRAVVSVFISRPEFDSQTKNRLTTPKKEIEAMFRERLAKEFNRYLNKNENIKKGMLKRFLEYRESQNKLLSRKDIKKLIITNENTGDKIRRKSVVPKLIECNSKEREGTELIITEGDSAAGSAILCRDVRNQAILPIKGKILNVSKISKPQECLQNQEVLNIVNAIGSGFLSTCDSRKSRYEKISILADADPDGKNIATLLISVFVNLLPDLVKEEMVEIIEPPLYGWIDNKKFKFTSDLKTIPKGKKVNRYKGLGEMSPDELYNSCINPAMRKSLVVSFPRKQEEFKEIMTSASKKYSILKNLGIILYEK